jgi:O-methyltransferase involved in polyketide biosynthesis
VAVRTRYIDDALGQALASAVDQVVILGAGFDSRAYVFEVVMPTRTASVT